MRWSVWRTLNGGTTAQRSAWPRKPPNRPRARQRVEAEPPEALDGVEDERAGHAGGRVGLAPAALYRVSRRHDAERPEGEVVGVEVVLAGRRPGGSRCRSRAGRPSRRRRAGSAGGTRCRARPPGSPPGRAANRPSSAHAVWLGIESPRPLQVGRRRRSRRSRPSRRPRSGGARASGPRAAPSDRRRGSTPIASSPRSTDHVP